MIINSDRHKKGSTVFSNKVSYRLRLYQETHYKEKDDSYYFSVTRYERGVVSRLCEMDSPGSLFLLVIPSKGTGEDKKQGWVQTLRGGISGKHYRWKTIPWFVGKVKFPRVTG